MNKPSVLMFSLLGVICVSTFAAGQLAAADADFDETAGVTLFAFDSVAIPFSQNLRLEMRSPTRHPANPVVQRGKPGTPDAFGVQFYGSVIREGGKFRMWYVAFDDDTENKVASARWRAAYAESRDGLHWTKPNLGLVEYRGNKNNNLILTDPAPLGFVNLKVLSDPDDPDPARRYKISTHVYFRNSRRLGTLAPFASADGLRWKLLTPAKPKNAELRKEDLVLPAVHFEPCGGLYKWDGMYYVCGQNAMNATRPYQGRVARTYRSPDFVNWSQTSSVAFVREPQHTYLGPGRSREGEQTHEAISVWNRGNVLLGLYGIWHGGKEWKDVTIDLGFVVSNDGVSFREPAHEWTFLKRGEDGAWDQGGVLQGQGFENIGDETFIYYGAWDPRHWQDTPERGGVGIATLPRDRFGDLVVEEAGKGSGDYQLPVITSEFVTAAVPTKAGIAHRFYLNADGLGAQANLKVELLDDRERPLPGFSGKAAAIVRQSGFHTPILWNGQTAIVGLPGRIRLKVSFEGEQNTKVRFSALYIQ
ncbi:MAG: hypothetical protein HZC54_18635 [Verrucomicrobia bacterium]|nr:hypothetical protein [Verrucomicrobiota bacterium]